MIIYLAGPYRSATEEGEKQNIANARGVAKLLWGKGYTVMCPHLNTLEFDKSSFESIPYSLGVSDTSVDGLDITTIMRGDKEFVERSDALVLLPGWESSEGSKIEKAHAEQCGIPVFMWPDLPPLREPKKETVLEEAQRLISGIRDKSYGHPLDDFRGTAAMWTGLWWRKLKDGERFYPWDVPTAVNCIKLSREQNSHKRDNPVDGAGYWGTLQEVYDEMARRGLSPDHFINGGI